MKKELIDRIVEREEHEHFTLKQILEEELPDFQRIDEERFKRIYASKVCDIGLHIKEYNSTLPPALKPLPKEMPKDLTRFAMGHDVYEVWDKIISEYGTPEPKPSLPTVEELAKEMPQEFEAESKYNHCDDLWDWVIKPYGTLAPKPNIPSVEELAKEIASVRVDLVDEHKLSHKIAQKLHDKYILPTREDVDKLKQELEDERIKHAACGTAALGYFTGCHEKYLSASLQDVINLRLKYEGLLNHPHEWWQGDFKGLKVKTSIGAIKELDGKLYVRLDVGVFTTINNCTPYTPPTASEIIAKHNLSEEEIRAIREGK